MIKAGIIYKTKFTVGQSKAFSSYIDYIDRDEATRGYEYSRGEMSLFNEYDGYNDYMGNPEKSTGLFTADKDILTSEGKAMLKDVFQYAQDNGSVMMQNIFSFDKEWLAKYGLLTDEGLREDKLREYTRAAMATLIEKEGLQDFVWSAAVHYNTDHYHVHIAMVEPRPSWEEGKGRCRRGSDGELYQRGMIKETHNEAVKTRFANLVMGTAKENAVINDIIRNRIIAGKRDIELLHDTDIRNELEDLMNMMPKDMRKWRYNMAALDGCRGQIDRISNLFIKKYFREDINELQQILGEQSAKYKEAYGGSEEAEKFRKSTIEDLFGRLGNSILSECREIEKKHRERALKAEDELTDPRLPEPGSDKTEKELGELGSPKNKDDSELGTLGVPKESGMEIDIIDEISNDIIIAGIDNAADTELDEAEASLYEPLDFSGEFIEWSEDYRAARNLIFNERNYRKALALLEKEALKGNALAINDIADMYKYGRGVDIDLPIADIYYSRAYEAFSELQKSEGKHNAFLNKFLLYRMGKMHNYGLGVPENKTAAADCFELCPDNVFANYALAELYYKGDGVAEDIRKAVGLYEKACSDEKIINPYGAYKLGRLYKTGVKKGEEEIIPQDKALSEHYYAVAFSGFSGILAKNRADDNMQYKVGVMLLDGLGTVKDIDSAKEYLESAADAGNVLAQYALGKLYIDPENKHYNLEEGVRLLEAVASAENQYAQYLLGTVYLDKNTKFFYRKKGFEMLEKSAAQGNQYAQVKLGLVYLQGEIVPQNLLLAEKWLKEAFENGNQFAGDVLNSKPQKYRHVHLYRSIPTIRNLFRKDIESIKNQAIYERMRREEEYNAEQSRQLN